MTTCEQAKVGWALGDRRNAVLERKIQPVLEQAQVVACLNGDGKAHLFEVRSLPSVGSHGMGGG